MTQGFKFLFVLSAVLLSLLFACRTPKQTQTADLHSYFQRIPVFDTLHVEITDSDDTLQPGKLIPNSLFFKAIPAGLMQEIDYLADSSQAQVYARGYFPIHATVSAYWVEIHQFWFQNQSLFIYDRPGKVFYERITLAEWYGGESGQILTGSWIFNYDGDRRLVIVRRDIQHSTTVSDEGEAVEHMDESAGILRWDDFHFVELPLKDSLSVIKRYPIRSVW